MKATLTHIVSTILVLILAGGGCRSHRNNQFQRSATGQCPVSAASNDQVTCAGVDEYESCLQRSCAPHYTACMGKGYHGGSYSGACKAELECVMDCACNDAECELSCYRESSALCIDCANQLELCEQNSGCPQPVCHEKAVVRGAPAGRVRRTDQVMADCTEDHCPS